MNAGHATRPPKAYLLCFTDHECSDIVFCRPQTATDYGPYIQNLPSPLHTTSVVEACTQLLVDQWHYLRANVRAAHPMPRVQRRHQVFRSNRRALSVRPVAAAHVHLAAQRAAATSGCAAEQVRPVHLLSGHSQDRNWEQWT